MSKCLAIIAATLIFALPIDVRAAATTAAPSGAAPIAVPADAPAGGSGETGLAVGSGVALIVLALGILALTSVAFMPSN